MKSYVLKKVNSPMTVVDERWARVEAAELDFVWKDAFPSPYVTTAKAVHCECGITVLLESNEWPLRVTHYVYGSEVCEDSCMEFFFIPNTTDHRYLNFEVNPAGNTHVRIGESRHGRVPFDAFDMGARVETNITPYKGWRVKIFVPYTMLDELYGKHDSTMRANFYKCGDLTERKHYSTWNPIEVDAPDYHRPEWFGELILSEEAL